MIKVMGESVAEQIQSIDNILVSMMRHTTDVKKDKGNKYIIPFFCAQAEGIVETIFIYAPNHQQRIEEGRLYISDCGDGLSLECIAIEGAQIRKFSQSVKKGDNYFAPNLVITKDTVMYFNIITPEGQPYPVGMAGTIEGAHVCI